MLVFYYVHFVIYLSLQLAMLYQNADKLTVIIFTDGVLSYSMPQGDRRGKHSSDELAFLDFTYDGIIKEDHLYNGIGQLMDGEEGQANFRSDLQARGIKGYEWVGWKTENPDDNIPVQIVFKFDDVRNFTLLNIHANNFYDKDVSVFSMAHVYFSVSGIYYQPNYIDHKFERDSWMEYARTVPIPLENRVGKYVKVELFFDRKWMLISEVSFKSGTHLVIWNYFGHIGFFFGFRLKGVSVLSENFKNYILNFFLVSEVTKANVTMELPPLTPAVHTTKAPTIGERLPVDRNINIQIGQGNRNHWILIHCIMDFMRVWNNLLLLKAWIC